MVKGVGQMYITGPDVIKAVTGEEVTHEDLGGATSHSSISGVAHFSLSSEEECLEQVRKLLRFIPPNNMEETTITETGEIEISFANLSPEDKKEFEG